MQKSEQQRRTEIVRAKREKRAELRRVRLELRGLQQWHRQQVLQEREEDQAVDKEGKTRRLYIPEKNILRVKIPETFSLLEDPKGALAFIRNLQLQLGKTFIREVHLDHGGCKTLGLCAQAYLDMMLMDASARRPRSNCLYLSGRHSNHLDVNIMLRATGTLRHLRHPDMLLPPEVEKQIRRSELFSGRGNRPESSRNRDEAGTRLVQYFNECLMTQGVMLDPRGRKYLSDLITEVVGNCEEHGGGRWFTIGYFREPPEKGIGDCHIVIFNLGRSFYESLSAKSSSTRSKEEISKMAERHARKGFWSQKWDVETLWTLYGLQEGITRYRYTPGGQTRGAGTVEMIRAFSSLAGDFQKMCIVSGNSYILFDGTYSLRAVRVGETETRQIIAFNRKNDLASPPDGNYVFRLPIAFPGTMVSMHFTLEQNRLTKLALGG